jgi:hypothetical protein
LQALAWIFLLRNVELLSEMLLWRKCRLALRLYGLILDAGAPLYCFKTVPSTHPLSGQNERVLQSHFWLAGVGKKEREGEADASFVQILENVATALPIPPALHT